MEETPSSGRQYLSSQNPSESSDDSNKTVSANLVTPNGGYHDQQEVDSGRVVSPADMDHGTSDSERTVSFEKTPSDGHGDIMEVDSGLRKARAQDSRSEEAEKDEKHTGHLKTCQGKSVDPCCGQQVVILPMKTGVLKILPEKIKNREIGCSKIPQTDKTVVVPLPRLQNRREELPVPQWLKDYKTDVADLDGWRHWQVHRYDTIIPRKDKFSSHRDYVYTFRSKIEVKRFLDTGEVKGKGLLQKKSSDPGGQSSGPRHSTKRRMELPARDPDRKLQGYGLSTSGEMDPSSSKLPHGFV